MAQPDKTLPAELCLRKFFCIDKAAEPHPMPTPHQWSQRHNTQSSSHNLVVKVKVPLGWLHAEATN